MDFSTPCCKKPPPERAPAQALWLRVGALLRRWALLAALHCAAMLAGPPAALAGEGAPLWIERSEAGLLLSASLQFDLPDLAQDALAQGIAMQFVAEADVLRQRWYWSDKTVAQATRYMRLSYQPLTRRWRLQTSPQPFSGSGLGLSSTLGQNYDDFADALAALQRIARWKIAEPGAVAPDRAYTVQLRLRLDTSTLPRPFQIGAIGRSGWGLLAQHSAVLEAQP